MNYIKDKISSDWPGWLVFLFLANLFVITLQLIKGVMIHPDAPVYLWSAQALDQGKISEAIKAYPMLFYPFMVMCIKKLGFDWLIAGRAISIVASFLALFPFFHLSKRCSPGWPAVIVTFVFVLLPEYNSISFAAIRDPLYLCMSLYSVYFAVCYTERKELKWFIAAIFFSICLPLLRMEGIVVSFVIVIWTFLYLLRRLNAAGRIWALAAISVFVGFFIILFSLSATGRSLLRLDKGLSIAQKLFTEPPFLTFYLEKLDYLAHNDVYSGFGNNFWQVIERNWQWVFGVGMLQMLEKNLNWLLILLGVIGFRAVLRSRNTGWMVLALFVANILLILAKYVYSGAIETRLMLFPAILWLLLAGAGLSSVAVYLSEKLSAGIFRKKLNTFIILGVVLTLPFAYKTISMDYNINIPVLRDGCYWMNEKIFSDGKDWQVWVNMRRMVWFLDREDVKSISWKTKKNVQQILHKRKTPIAVILLLSRRNEQDIILMNKLVEEKGFSSRVFTDPEDKKNIVVAVWRKNQN